MKTSSDFKEFQLTFGYVLDDPFSISDIWIKSLVDNGFRARLIPIEKIVDLKIAYNDLLDKGTTVPLKVE